MKLVEIHAAGDFIAMVVPAVPMHSVVASRVVTLHQSPDFLTKHVKDSNNHMTSLEKLETNLRFRIKGVRIVLKQLKIFWHTYFIYGDPRFL